MVQFCKGQRESDVMKASARFAKPEGISSSARLGLVAGLVGLRSLMHLQFNFDAFTPVEPSFYAPEQTLHIVQWPLELCRLVSRVLFYSATPENWKL